MSDYLAQSDPGQRILGRCDELAAISRTGSGVTRLYLTGEHRAAMALVAQWMREAGMEVHTDQAANVIGRYPPATGESGYLLIGSHIDSVIDAGKYDGPLGVITAIDCVAIINRDKRRLPFGIEVLAFGDEEGTRFGTTLIGSRAVAGSLTPQDLAITDKDGVSVENALRVFGLDPTALSLAARKREDVLAYVEVHIEQGPVLEQADLPVGIVTSISAQIRKIVTLTGEANHAGTVPMRLRHDPFLAGAEVGLALERIACHHSRCGRHRRKGGCQAGRGECDPRAGHNQSRYARAHRCHAQAIDLGDGQGDRPHCQDTRRRGEGRAFARDDGGALRARADWSTGQCCEEMRDQAAPSAERCRP